MRNLFFRKLLALLVIAGLISLRLSNLSAEVFVEPVEDAIFDIPFISAEEIPGEGKTIKVKPKRAFDFVLAPCDELMVPQGITRPQVKPMITVAELKEIATEIFIPPEIVS